MKKTTFKLLSFIALSAITTQAKAQSGWSSTSPSGVLTTNTNTTDVNITNKLNVGNDITTTWGTVKGFNLLGTNAVFSNGFIESTGNITSNTGTVKGYNLLGTNAVYSNGFIEATGNITSNTGTVKGYNLQGTNAIYSNGFIEATGNITSNTGTVEGYNIQGTNAVYSNGFIEASGNITSNYGTVKGFDLYATSNAYVDGKLRIGSSISMPGTYKLYVKDGILTEKVKVALSSDLTNWSDFVFDENYDLKPLAEVEKFIQKNKHLPEIPSTEEVHKEGLDLAQMDAKLLQKIEELTLYIIQQQKEIEKLKKKLK